jgi:hypothetical protein
MRFGQVHISAQGNNFSIHHIDDAAPTEFIDNPSRLRDRLTLDSNGNFRALRTGADLPQGWCVKVNSFESLLAVLETIYPTAWIDHVQQQNGTLPIQTMAQVAQRQTGIYKLIAKLDRLPDIVTAHCGLCVRQPTWFDSSGGEIPCPEPCQCWMSFALQQIEAERETKVSLELSPDDMQTLRSALKTAITRPDADIRPAEYEDSRNPARLRALLAKMDHHNSE